jgi:hypothetical protein
MLMEGTKNASEYAPARCTFAAPIGSTSPDVENENAVVTAAEFSEPLVVARANSAETSRPAEIVTAIRTKTYIGK